ncbi:MAG: HAMP domain-containing histidine kinase, partial [Pirellulales bacterium]|nr:HAMP domain-containing histidine kinase [Pirellulales bacterium]
RLRRQQVQSERLQDVQQDIRVALWRLDSRLGPYVATVHDPRSLPQEGGQDFVIQRFRIENSQQPDSQQPGGKGSRYRYVIIGQEAGKGTRPAQKSAAPASLPELGDAIPIDAVVGQIDEQYLNSIDTGVSLVQSYNSPGQAAGPSQRSELDNRNSIVQRQVLTNKMEMTRSSREGPADELGVKIFPIWVGQQLAVVRAQPRGVGRILEGVWIDWPQLRASLLRDVDDLLPGARLEPVRPEDEIDPSRTLAALPATLVPAAMTSVPVRWSATDTALLLAWLAFVGASLIAAVALSRLMALSQRRASFVSAVTHELRTPLTTFRLYSDLLSREMVQDPQDRKEYLQTLRREADRLTHLVDNVLRYSRLERTSKRPQLEPVLISQWLDRITPRLRDRLASAAMELEIELQGDGQWMTDPAAMEQVIFNLIDNAAKYAQDSTDRRVHLRANLESGRVWLCVQDHGSGVPPSLRATMFKPFSKSVERAAETAAGVGLGLALAKQTVAALGGQLAYEHAPGGGASFRLTLPQKTS